VSVDRAGNVFAGDAKLDQLRVETLAPGQSLQHEAGTLVVPDATRRAVPPDARDVRQGFVEGSNVDTIGTMVDMISVQRAYAAVQKAVTALDGIHGTICNELGKLG
jgi:flagellar basal body rod protein FlgG